MSLGLITNVGGDAQSTDAEQRCNAADRRKAKGFSGAHKPARLKQTRATMTAPRPPSGLRCPSSPLPFLPNPAHASAIAAWSRQCELQHKTSISPHDDMTQRVRPSQSIPTWAGDHTSPGRDRAPTEHLPVGTRATRMGPGLVPTTGSTALMCRSPSGASSCVRWVCFPAASLLPLNICSPRCPPGPPAALRG